MDGKVIAEVDGAIKAMTSFGVMFVDHATGKVHMLRNICNNDPYSFEFPSADGAKESRHLGMSIHTGRQYILSIVFVAQEEGAVTTIVRNNSSKMRGTEWLYFNSTSVNSKIVSQRTTFVVRLLPRSGLLVLAETGVYSVLPKPPRPSRGHGEHSPVFRAIGAPSATERTDALAKDAASQSSTAAAAAASGNTPASGEAQRSVVAIMRPIGTYQHMLAATPTMAAPVVASSSNSNGVAAVQLAQRAGNQAFGPEVMSATMQTYDEMFADMERYGREQADRLEQQHKRRREEYADLQDQIARRIQEQMAYLEQMNAQMAATCRDYDALAFRQQQQRSSLQDVSAMLKLIVEQQLGAAEQQRAIMSVKQQQINALKSYIEQQMAVLKSMASQHADIAARNMDADVTYNAGVCVNQQRTLLESQSRALLKVQAVVSAHTEPPAIRQEPTGGHQASDHLMMATAKATHTVHGCTTTGLQPCGSREYRKSPPAAAVVPSSSSSIVSQVNNAGSQPGPCRMVIDSDDDSDDYCEVD